MKILHDHIPKIKISWESLTANAHEEALPSNGLGSWYVGSILNGVGTAGLGWKYGYEIPMNEIPGEYSQIYDHWKTYAFCLDQPHIVVLCSCKVILVNDMMFRCPFRVDTSLSILGGKIRKINAQAVPIIHTGPWDSDRIPRPEYTVIIASPSRSRSWSASQTQVPCDQREETTLKKLSGNTKEKTHFKIPRCKRSDMKTHKSGVARIIWTGRKLRARRAFKISAFAWTMKVRLYSMIGYEGTYCQQAYK